MHDLIGYLNCVVDPYFIITKSNNQIIVDEEKNDSGCKKITFNLKGKKVFAFTLDKNRNKKKDFRTFQFFNAATGCISKINDGNLIIVEDSKIIILLLELKSDNYNISDVMLKLKNSQMFSNYLINMINTHYMKNYVINDIEYKNILFTSGITTKGTTTGNKKVKFLKKENLLFARLACNRTYTLESFL